MGDAVDETVRAYDLDAEAYAGRTQVSDGVRADLEELGRQVRRTEVKPGFVALLRGQGHACWSSVSVRSGIAGAQGETWLELSAARDEVSR